jgi:hypothetical protein
MKTVKIQFDFNSGIFWPKYDSHELGKYDTGIPVIDNDPEIWRLNDEIQNLYDSYYEFNSHEQGCWFNEEQERKDKEKMLSLLEQVLARLETINDGSFVVDDQESERLKAL